MVQDVYRLDHICYLDETNRKGTAARLMYAGYVSFQRTPIVAHLQGAVPMDLVPWFFSYDYLADLSRIGFAFENYVKAKILLAGYVVHEVREYKRADRALLSILDLVQDHASRYEAASGYNVLPGVQTKTLGYERLLREPHLHQIPADLVMLLDSHRVLRNSNHYVDAEPQDFDAKSLEPLATFMATKVRDELNQLAQEPGDMGLRV